MRFASIVAAALLALTASAVPAPTAGDHVLHEKRDVALPAWMKKDRLHPHARVPVRIGMTQSNLDKGHDLLMEV